MSGAYPQRPERVATRRGRTSSDRVQWVRPAATAVGALLLGVVVHLARGGPVPHGGVLLLSLVAWTAATTGLAVAATRRHGSPVASAGILTLGQVGMEVGLVGPHHLADGVLGPALVWHAAWGAVLGVALLGVEVASDTVTALLGRVLPPRAHLGVAVRPEHRPVRVVLRVPPQPSHHASAWSLRGPPRLA